MEDKKMHELGDDALDTVAGGSWQTEDLSNFGEYVGDIQMYCRTCNGYTGTTEQKLYQNGVLRWAECKQCGKKTKFSVERNRFDIDTA